MGRQPCCDKVGLKKGPWTAEEDKKLINFILTNGQCCWRAVPKLAGLLRCGKSCRLRWTNYLRPDLKRGLLSEDEEKMVIDLHAQMGNRWSKIASHLPGRTDNEIKNHWNTHIKKKLKKMGIDPLTHMPLPPQIDDQLPQEYSQNQELSKGPSEIQVETSMHSTIIDSKEEEREEDKCINTSALFEPMQIVNNGIFIDEVPLVDPCEILVPSTNSLITLSSSSTSCSSTTSSYGDGFSNATEDLEFLHPEDSSVGTRITDCVQDLEFMPNFDWQFDFSDNISFWDDYMMSSLSFLMENDYDTNFAVQLQPPSA